MRGLIAIRKIELLKQLFNTVIIPSAVEQELLVIHSLHAEIHTFLRQPWVQVKEVTVTPDYHIIRKYLDKGEAEAITLARQLHSDLLLMDENKGRQLAHDLHLKVLGLIGVLIKAKKDGLISEMKPLLNDLIYKHGFWISSTFYNRILKEVNE